MLRFIKNGLTFLCFKIIHHLGDDFHQFGALGPVSEVWGKGGGRGGCRKKAVPLVGSERKWVSGGSSSEGGRERTDFSLLSILILLVVECVGESGISSAESQVSGVSLLPSGEPFICDGKLAFGCCLDYVGLF